METMELDLAVEVEELEPKIVKSSSSGFMDRKKNQQWSGFMD